MSARQVDQCIARTASEPFIVLGTLIAIVGLAWLLQTGWFSMQAAQASGTIIGVERCYSADCGESFHPVFRFTDRSGVVHVQRAASGSLSCGLVPGSRVTVLYNPFIPGHSKIHSFRSLWLAPLLLTAFGLLFGGCASGWLFLVTQAHRRQPAIPTQSRRRWF